MSLIKVNKNWSPLHWVMKQVVYQKLNNPLGYTLGALGAIGLAMIISLLPLKVAMLLVGGLLGIPLIFLCFTNLHFGINVMLCNAFLLGLITKYVDAPVGTSLDALLMLMLFGLLVRLVKDRDYSFAKSSISVLIIIWIYYNLIQVINPWAQSKLAWIYTVRTVALLLCLYFVACFAFNSLKRILTTVKLIVGLSFLAALYSLKQEFLGFTDTEMAWLHADEERFRLIFQWSRLRVFSFFSDPTTFGILMGYMGIFCLVLATGPYKIWQRGLLLFAFICMMMGMAYAGSRTPFVMVPIGIMFYMLLTFNRKTIIATGFFLLLGTAFMMKSTGNAVVYRIQSAFNPTDDASVHVRLKNQARIQPYIQTHPVGAGLGSTGFWGKRFTPDSWLASFAHDSLYVRLAVETGWIGLLIYLALLFSALKTGIYYYFRVSNPVIKNVYLGLIINVFLLSLASYPQEAITLLPTSIAFYIMLGMLVRLKDFDENFAKPSELSAEKLPS